MPVEWKGVFSSNVERIGHDEEKNELLVQWKNGKVSAYSNVSAAEAEDVANSWSVGGALRDQVIGKKSHRYL